MTDDECRYRIRRILLEYRLARNPVTTGIMMLLFREHWDARQPISAERSEIIRQAVEDFGSEGMVNENYCGLEYCRRATRKSR